MKIRHIFSIALLFCAFNLSATTWYVKTTGNNANTGASWTQAFRDVQKALDVAVAGDQIWVAAGTYAPTSTVGGNSSPIWRTFRIVKNIALYGGFTGTESSLGERDWESNETILSGVQDEVLHVVYSSGVTNDCVVDGFTITGGNARLAGGVTTSLNSAGGGWYNDAYNTTSSPTINHCKFTGNLAGTAGGAFLNNAVGGTSHIVFNGCTFTGNDGGQLGGAVHSEGGDVIIDISECVFDGNESNNGGAITDNSSQGSTILNISSTDFFRNEGGKGGAVSLMSISGNTEANISGCNLSGNRCNSFGAAIHVFARFANIHTNVTNSVISGNYCQLDYVLFNQLMDSGSAKFDVTNCTIAGNDGIIGNSLNDTISFTNCIIRRNSSVYTLVSGGRTKVNYCNLESGYIVPGVGNYVLTPAFVWAPGWQSAPTIDGDYHLTSCAPDINRGTSVNAPLTDKDGNPRPISGAHDVGAYEKGMTASCKNVNAYLNTSGNITLPLNLVNDGSEGCNPLKFKVNNQETINFSCSDIGPHNYNVVVSDSRNNTSTCAVTIQVLDTVAPVLVCPANQTIAAGAECRTQIGIWAPVSYTDNCPGTFSGLIQQPYDFTWLQGHGTSVNMQLSIKDAHLNIGYCHFTLTLKDVTPPAVACKNLTVNLNANGQGAITTGQVFQSGSDNCGTVNQVSVLPNTFNCSNLGQNTVVLTVNDGNENTSTCSATVTVTDAIAPAVVCKPFSANLNANGVAGITTADVFQSGSDNCGVVNQQSVAPNTFNCSNLGTNIVTLTVNDSHGNTGSCTATVTVADALAPTVVCKPFTISINANGTGSITPGDVFQTGSDNCGAVNVQSVAPNTFNCSNLGVNTVTLTVNDGHGNTAFCNATVTVQDITPPTVACKSYTAGLNANGSFSLTTAHVFQSGSDNCGVVNQESVVPNTFNCSNLGVHTVTLTVNDGHGNSSTCSAVVTVADAIAPTMLCKNVTLSLDVSGQATLSIAQVNNGSFDNCSIAALELNQTLFTCANVGPNAVNLTGTDPSGNKGVCTAVVTVTDPIIPVAKCKNVTAYLGSNGSATVLGSAVNNGSSDNCSFSLTLTPATFQCNNIGFNTVTLKATDVSGNTATCTARVTVLDAAAPTALCKNATVWLNSVGQGTLLPSQVDNGSSDNCGITSMTLSKTQYNCSEIQGSSWNVTLTLKDGSSNTSSCSALVTVKDGIAPTAICEDVTVNLGSTGKATVYGATLAGGSFDNCSVWSYSPVAKVYTTANLGANNLVITVKDWSGNAATCTSVVTVLPYNNFSGGNEDRNAEQTDAEAVTDQVLFPNPSTGDAGLRFVLAGAQEYTVQVFDLSGRLVQQHHNEGVEGENIVPIRLQEETAGIYLVVFYSGERRTTHRLVLIK